MPFENTEHRHTLEEEHKIREAALDQTIEASFPASDPPSSNPNPERSCGARASARQVKTFDSARRFDDEVPRVLISDSYTALSLSLIPRIDRQDRLCHSARPSESGLWRVVAVHRARFPSTAELPQSTRPWR